MSIDKRLEDYEALTQVNPIVLGPVGAKRLDEILAEDRVELPDVETTPTLSLKAREPKEQA